MSFCSSNNSVPNGSVVDLSNLKAFSGDKMNDSKFEICTCFSRKHGNREKKLP